MDKVQSIPNQSQIPKNGQALGKFSDSGPSNPQNSDRLWADLGLSNPQNRGQPYIGASRGLVQRTTIPARIYRSELFRFSVDHVEGLSFCISPLSAFQSPAPRIRFSLADLEPHGKDGGEWSCFNTHTPTSWI